MPSLRLRVITLARPDGDLAATHGTPSDAIGRPLRYEAIPNDVARHVMGAIMPARYVDAFFRFFVDGRLDESPVFPTVEQVLGRAPRTFARAMGGPTP